MRHLRIPTLSFAVLGALTTACTVQQPMIQPVTPAPAQAMQAGQIELLIALKPGSSIADLEDLGRRHGFTIVRYWPQIHSAAVRLERFGKAETVINALTRADNVLSVQPSGPVTPEGR